MSNHYIMENTEGACRKITLDRPELLNAFNIEMSEAFCHAVKKAAGDKQIRVVVLQGAGRAFSAGGDLKLLKQHISSSDRVFKQISGHLHEAIEQITTMPKTVVAAVKGPAYAAGFGVAMSCDIVVASHISRFCPSFINLGISPNAATTYFLPRMLGTRRALEAFVRGRVFAAPEALELGLVNHVWEDESFEEELKILVTDLASRCGPTIGRIKKLIGATYSQSFHDHLAMEREEIAASSRSDFFKEKVTKFVERHEAMKKK